MSRPRIPAAEYMTRYVVDENGCHIWTGGSFGRYGSAGSYGAAHRLSYEFHVGPIPEGKHVLHRCDVPRCINPAHLWIGDHADNMADRHAKGREAPSHRRKLTFEQAEAIRSDTRSQRKIAADYGVSKQSVLLIKRGVAYRG